MPLSQRIRLTADTTYHVATNGDDANDGSLANPWRTLQRAYDFFADDLDLCGFSVVAKVSPGTYSAGASSAKSVLGAGNNHSVKFQGDTVNPGTVTIDSVADCFSFGAGSGGGPKVWIEGFALKSSAGNAIASYGGGTGVAYDRCIFLACPSGVHLKVAHGGELGAERGAGGYVMAAGSAIAHAMAETGGRFTSDGLTIDYQNYPTFSLAGFYCADGQMNIHGMTLLNKTFVNGMKYACKGNGTIAAATRPGDTYPGEWLAGSGRHIDTGGEVW